MTAQDARDAAEVLRSADYEVSAGALLNPDCMSAIADLLHAVADGNALEAMRLVERVADLILDAPEPDGAA